MGERTGWIGIDYGKKLKGTTAIAFSDDQYVTVRQAAEKQDADQWLLAWAEDLAPDRIFIDAPLSLPLAFYKPERADDYFYRACDREIKGMSPMFLGALTARAINLKHELEAMDVEVLEAYPVGLAQELLADQCPTGKEDPKKQKQWQLLAGRFPAELHKQPVDQHQVDALLTWWIGYRYWQNEHKEIGDRGEGCVMI